MTKCKGTFHPQLVGTPILGKENMGVGSNWGIKDLLCADGITGFSTEGKFRSLLVRKRSRGRLSLKYLNEDFKLMVAIVFLKLERN